MEYTVRGKSIMVNDAMPRIIKLCDFFEWAEENEKLFYNNYDSDDFETTTGWYSRDQYFELCPPSTVSKHLSEYLKTLDHVPIAFHA